MKRIVAIAFAACAAIGLARAASAQEYYGPESLPPQPAPPPAAVEDYGPPPAPSMPAERAYWVRGHWDWNGVQYVWVGGHYVERPAGLYWEPGRWVARDGQWVWIGGHWRR
jgi:hypothetical protein